ncbi:MAG: lysozyme inhibitor LprI family protein [Chthoniobacteraceae bacterium]
MQPSVASRCIAVLALWLLSSGSRAVAGEPGFRRFANTISPDGACVLAWGWGEEEQPANLNEWAAGRDTAGDSVANYLVDAVGAKVLAVIPEHDHFMTSEGRSKQFSGLAVGWSEDSQTALAIYEGRWSADSILWIHPKARTFTEVLAPLDKAYRGFLAKNEKLKDAGEISFSLPALLPGGVLVIDARARPMVNKPREYNCRLKVLVKTDGKEPKCRLLSGRKIPEPPADDKVEDELTKAYQQLRAKLNDADRATLKDRQLLWLKQREALAESDRSFFTRMRISCLRTRAENEQPAPR